MAICYIHGSFMNDNFGDFLLYDITYRTCRELIDQDNIISADVSSTYVDSTNVNAFSKVKAINMCDCAVVTGGGYFGEPNKRFYKEYWNLRFIFKHAIPLCLLSVKKKRYIVVGLGVGPLSWKISRLLARRVLNCAEKVILRDTESYDYAKRELNVQREIEVLPDLVLGCDIECYTGEDLWVKSILLDTQYKMAVHLTTKNSDDGKGLDLVIDDLIDFATQHDGDWSYYIICDQSSERKYKRANELTEKLKHFNAIFVPYESPTKLCTLLKNMDVVLTDKLHVGIVSTKMGKYVVSTANHQKTSRFYKQLGRERYTRRLQDIKKGDVLELLNNFYLSPTLPSITELELQSKKNLDKIKQFLQYCGF